MKMGAEKVKAGTEIGDPYTFTPLRRGLHLYEGAYTLTPLHIYIIYIIIYKE